MSCQYPVHTVHAFVQVIFPLGSHRKRGGKMLRPGTTSAGALWRPWTKTLASDGVWQRPCYQKRCGPVCNPAGASHLTYLNIISWTSDDGTQDEARIELHLIWKLQVGREGGQMHSKHDSNAGSSCHSCLESTGAISKSRSGNVRKLRSIWCGRNDWGMSGMSMSSNKHHQYIQVLPAASNRNSQARSIACGLSSCGTHTQELSLCDYVSCQNGTCLTNGKPIESYCMSYSNTKTFRLLSFLQVQTPASSSPRT